jgi:hypothetical protein
MEMKDFIVVGENIHCTRILKRSGKRSTKFPDGREGVPFHYKGEDRVLPVPSNWATISPAYNEGKIRHRRLMSVSPILQPSLKFLIKPGWSDRTCIWILWYCRLVLIR